MFIVISPAKSLDFENKNCFNPSTLPFFQKETQELIEICKKFDASDISRLMKVSDSIASLNVARFNDFSKNYDKKNSKEALFFFKGDVYQGLNAQSLNEIDLNWAQENLYILSGLYGLLKSFDLIQPYRLEMGTKLENAHGKNLYEFWDTKVTDLLNSYMNEKGVKHLVNLASNEYFKVLKTKSIDAQIITPTFLDFKNGKYKIISFYAKKARGLFAQFMIKNKVTNYENLKLFDYDGYSYCDEESSIETLVFKRKLA